MRTPASYIWEATVIVMMQVLVNCLGKDAQVMEVFKATLTEIVKTHPAALRKAPGYDLRYEYVAGKDNLVLLHLPVLDTELDRLKSVVGPIWRREAFARGLLPEDVIKNMREKGELPAK